MIDQFMDWFDDPLNPNKIPILGPLGKRIGTTTADFVQNPSVDTFVQMWGAWGEGFLATLGGYELAKGVIRPVKTTPTVLEDLRAAAGRAVKEVGTGKGGAYGTRVHSAFEREVNALGRSDLSTEVSYLNGEVVPRGTPGSIRVDIVEGPLKAPTAVYDLKAGGAKLTPDRIGQIQQHIPGGRNVPVMEVRP
jgi:hypothetical protein